MRHCANKLGALQLRKSYAQLARFTLEVRGEHGSNSAMQHDLVCWQRPLSQAVFLDDDELPTETRSLSE